MNTFQEKRQKKIERFKELAESHKERAEVGDRIPKGHRADLKRMDSHMQKMSDHLETVKYYENKAASMESNKSIFIEDPEAKDFNKTWKKEGLQKALENWPGNKNGMLSIVEMYCKKWNHEKNQNEFFDRKCLPSYMLTNLGAKIKRYESKLAAVSNVKKLDSSVIFEKEGVRAVIEEMRVNIYFDSIPGEELRSKLKRSPLAMRWSPSAKCWTRVVSEATQGQYFKSTLIEVLSG